MESGANIIEVLSYEIISNKIKLLYEGVVTFKNKRLSITDSFKTFSQYISNQNFNHSFLIIEKEINDIIGKWDISESIELLRAQLEILFGKIVFVDQEIDKIETLQRNLLQYPDRHNRKNVIDKIGMFLQDINKISLSQIDNICNEIIPNIHAMVDVVIEKFADESNKVENNKKTAQQLKKRINGLAKYVDKYNLRQICREGNNVVEQILQTPNMLKPEEDSNRLQNVNHQLDQCVAQFKAEDKLFAQIKQELSDNRNSIWVDDYDVLMSALEKGACYEETPATQLQAQYDSIIGVKEKEINKAVNCFSEKILSFFANDIRALREKSCSRQDLQEIIEKMHRKVADDEWARKKKIMKIIGIALAVIALMIIIWVLRPWSFIVIGLIVAWIIYSMIKG